MEALYIEKHGHRPMGGAKQLDTITAAWGALSSRGQVGLSFNSTNWIIGRAAGYPTCCPEGQTPTWEHKQKDLERWGRQVQRIRRYLEELGLLTEHRPIMNTGRGHQRHGYRCLRLTLSRTQPYATRRVRSRAVRRGLSSRTKVSTHSVVRGNASSVPPLTATARLDAREPTRQSRPRAALAGWVDEQHIQEVGLGELRQAAVAGLPFSELAGAAFELLFGCPARLPFRTAWRWDAYGRMLDTYAHFGRGRRGAALDWLVDWMELEAEEIRDHNGREAVMRGHGERRRPPRSIAYFLPALRTEAHRWRRGVGRTRAERRQRRKRC